MAKSITLIVSGSIAAIKAPELIRQLRAKKIGVHVIVTAGGAKFVSLKEIEKLSGHKVSTDIFAPDEMRDMWHIRFSRETDLIVVAPASADLIAKMVHGIADDMASATLLANNKKLLVAPAMNTQMWIHPATQRNVAQLVKDGAEIIEPGVGMLACGEVGAGRMAEPEAIVKKIEAVLGTGYLALKGIKALVTSGPTHEAIDPVRYIANRSSGKQGHAIARALAAAGAKVTLVSGPTALPDPAGVSVKHVTTAAEMLAACEKALPADIAVCAAAVGDWRVTPSAQKIKKAKGKAPEFSLVENPDILRHISTHKKRPKLVIGFAAETGNAAKLGAEKRKEKGCDWIVANDVSDGKIFGEDNNKITLITSKKTEPWPRMSKEKLAEKLVEKMIAHLRKKASDGRA
jgi:phosphopantothenoylcysteine decarboxylase/phosphopantothenate--cysteine ligase